MRVVSYKANGLGNEVDWLGLTYNQRIIRGINKPYHEVAEPWQFFFDWVIWQFPRFYTQLSRGHDKTERGSWWALLWGKSRPDGQALACGTDKDNARLYLDAVKWQVKHHPHLFSGIKVQRYDVHFPNGSHIRVIPVNEGGSFGHTPDLLMVNDFHAWKNQDYWNNLWTAMGKRPNARIWIESNALKLGSPQAQWIRPFRDGTVKENNDVSLLKCKGVEFGDYVRARATCGPAWWFTAPRGMLASWQWPMLGEWQASMLPSAFRRLINNEDVADGDSFLTPELFDPCAFPEDTLPEPSTSSIRYVCVDMAATQDAAVVSLVSGFSMLVKDSEGKEERLPHFILHHQWIWTGRREQPIPINKVVSFANGVAAKYKAYKICDPWEMRSHVQADPSWQTLEFHKGAVQRSIPLEVYKAFASERIKVPINCAQAEQAKQGRKPAMWDLRRECLEAVLVEKAYGTRLDHKSGGFTDRIMSLGMGIVHMLEEHSLPLYKKQSVLQPVIPGKVQLGSMPPTWGALMDRHAANTYPGVQC